MVFALAIAGAGLVIGCSDEKPAATGASMDAPAGAATARKVDANTAPQLTGVTLESSRPQPGTLLQARAEASDPEGDAVNIRFEWRVDGNVIAGARDGSLVVPNVSKGSELSVTAIASDGRADSDPVTAKARVGNQKPTVASVRFEPAEMVKPGETVVAVAEGDDPDGDQLDFHYEWRVGEAVQNGDRERFDTSKLKRGDRLSVRVIASDGEDESTPVESRYLELGNSAPTITSQPPPGMGNDGIYHYSVEVRDPDRDRNLRFRLDKAPDGAKVDPLLGEITWKPSLAQAGTHEIAVVVSDGRGGETKQTFEVTVREVIEKVDAATPPPPASPAP
jgi:hypothetical protein